MQTVVEIYEVRVALGRAGNISFNALFYGRPEIQDVVAAINHKRGVARVFRLAPPDLFIQAVKRLGVPAPNHAQYDPSGDCVHLVTVDLHPVLSGAGPRKPSPGRGGRLDACPLCRKLPVYKVHGKYGNVLFHDCPGESGAPEIWFTTEASWDARNKRLRERYK